MQNFKIAAQEYITDFALRWFVGWWTIDKTLIRYPSPRQRCNRQNKSNESWGGSRYR